MKGDVKEKVISLVLGERDFPASSPCRLVAPFRIHVLGIGVFLSR